MRQGLRITGFFGGMSQLISTGTQALKERAERDVGFS
jgi:hypothetical protein